MNPLCLSRERCSSTGTMDDGVEPVLVIEDAQHQRRDQFFDDPSVAPVLQAVDDLLADARVPQGAPGALEVEVHALALVTDQGLEG